MLSAADGDVRADVLIVTAIPLEYAAVKRVDAGAVPGSTWLERIGPNNLRYAMRPFASASGGGRPLRVALVCAVDMGGLSAAAVALPLLKQLQPRVLAMAGVCAGRPGKTHLGDVIAADKLYFHDTGKRIGRTDADGLVTRTEQHDLATFLLRPDWKQALEHLDLAQIFAGADWLAERPVPIAWQELRVLHRLIEQSELMPDQAWIAAQCPQWEQVMEALWKPRSLADGTTATLLEDGALVVTEAGRKLLNRTLAKHRGALPDLGPWGKELPFALYVAPMASGGRVIEDETVWAELAESVRKTLGLEMEAAAIGAIAHYQRDHTVDAVVMKGVMDFANHGRDDHFKEFAARASAECLIAFLRQQVPTAVVPGFDDILHDGTTVCVPATLTPSQMLSARYGIVPWHNTGRADLLAQLDAWADGGTEGVAVRLIHAEGGVGKTRLAIEWVRRRRQQHALAGFVADAVPSGWLERLVGQGRPVVLVVDYAESRADLGALLARLLAYHQGSGAKVRVRLLLLARNAGDWWSVHKASSDAMHALLTATPPQALSPLATETDAREDVYVQAAMVFAALRRKSPVVRSPVSLADPLFERVLFVHMAALAAVEGLSFSAATLMDATLDHEERFWTRETEGTMKGVALHVARQCMAAATLRGGVLWEEDAQGLLIGLLAQQTDPDVSQIQLLRRLHHLYATNPFGPWLPALEPDPLGEALVLRVGAGHGGEGVGNDWIERVLGQGAPSEVLRHGMTVLGRASTREQASPLHAWIRTLLSTDLAARAPRALEAAKVVGEETAFSPLGDVLAERLEDSGDATLAGVLEAALPYKSVSLLRVAAWVAATLRSAAPVVDAEASHAARARKALALGVRLSALGRREEALAATQEAVGYYRTLAKSRPDTFHSDVAGSLNNLGNMLSELGRREEALAATQEAVGHYRALAKSRPDAFLPDLATSLNGLGIRLSALGRREDALAAAQEAVELRRTQAKSNPDSFLPDFATSLDNLGTMLSGVGRHEEALAAAQEAAELRRRLAKASPDAFLPDFAISLNNLGIRLNALGRREEALAAAQEAVELRRTLAKARPDAFLPGLAASLDNLGISLRALGRREEALSATREAVELRRTLAKARPDAFLPDLATSLNNLGNTLSAQGHRVEALAATQEAVELRRALAKSRPDAFLPDLAMSLNNLSGDLSALGRHEDALAATEEAVELRRALAKSRPDAFLPDLAMSLNNLGNLLSALGRLQDALPTLQEATGHYRTLAKSRPDAFLADLATSLNNLGISLSALGRREEALAATQESVELRRTLAKSRPDAFLPDLAGSLNNLGGDLSALGRREDALAAAQEAVALRRALAKSRPDAFLPDLAGSLNNLGLSLSELGRHKEALAATQEAMDHYRALAKAWPDAFLPDLATGLNNLGNMLSTMGRRDETTAVMHETVGHYRTLATSRPDAFLPYLAASLNNLGNMLSEMGRREEALAALQEAVALRRTLAERNPGAFLPSLATNFPLAPPELVKELSPRLVLLQARLGHVRLFDDVTLDFQGRPFTAILAENGHGKTTILQALAMALSGYLGANQLAGSADAYFDRRTLPEEPPATLDVPLCRIEVVARVDAPATTHIAREDDALLRASLTLVAGSKVFEGQSLLRVGSLGHTGVLEALRGGDGRGWFVVGYGVGRTLPRSRGAKASGHLAVGRLRSLFEPDPPIATGFAELLEDLQGIEAARAYTAALTLALSGSPDLPGILPAELSIRLEAIELRGSERSRGSTDLQDADRFVLQVGRRALKLPAAWLSAGFQSTIAWVADVIGQYALSQGHVVPPAEMEGLVLIDEIDLHLHPRWQVGLVPALKRVFPRMQFVVTTHSPMVLASLGADEVMILAQGEDGSLQVRPSDTTPALKTGSELYEHFFGIDQLYPTELGEQFQRYSFLSSNPYRDEAEEAEMQRLRKILQDAHVDPGWEPEARIVEEGAQ